MKILVTGATGFVGGRFVADFCDHYEIQTVSLRQTPVSQISFNDIEAIVHCAALVHQMQGAPRESYFQINYELTKELAIKAKASGVKHFIFLSTAHVYGVYGDIEHPERTLGPNTECHPHDPYGESKVAAENFLLGLQSADFVVSILRPPLVYGEGAKGNLLSLAKLIRRMPVLPFGYDKNRRSLIYVGNLVYFIHLVIQKRLPGIFLPQDERPLSIKDLILFLATTTQQKVFLFNPPALFLWALKTILPHYASRLYGSLALESTKSNRDLGYTPPYRTEEGFRRMG
jgi:UDP-glucose 4-epimerase